MNFKKDNALVGFFVLGGFIISIGLLFTLMGYNMNDDRIEYYMRFKSLSGIKNGSAITLRGYAVGEVIQVEPIYASNIYFKAKIKINKGLHIYRGTKASIINKNVIGDAQISLELPENTDTILQPGDTLFANQVINLDALITQMTKLTGNINNMVSSFGDLAGSNKSGVSTLLSQVNGAVHRVNKLLDGVQGSVVKTVENTAAMTRTLRIFAREVRRDPLLFLKGRN